MATIGSAVVRLSATCAAFSADLGKAQAALKGFGSFASGIGSKVALAFAAIGGTMFLKGQADAIDSTAKLGDRLGIATEQMQALQLAADLAGVDSESMA